MIKDEFRVSRLKAEMKKAGIDYLILRLPENVLYATGYWPVFGASMAVVPFDGETTIFYNEGEEDFAAESWLPEDEIIPYVYFGMQETPNPNRNFKRMLKELWNKKGYNWRGTIGYEGGFEFIGTQNISVEARVAAEPGKRMLRETFPEAELVDAYKPLCAARTVKSSIEIEKLRRACEVTCMGYAAARSMIVPGVKDCEVSAAVESAIRARGVGYKGARRARGYAFALSGKASSMLHNPYFVTSDRVLEEGDTCLIELDAYVDGYFCDMTRTMAAGEPSAKARRMWEIVKEELDTMLAMTRPGTATRDLCRAARDIAAKYGYDQHVNFPHAPGHGIGLQFHEMPSIHLSSEEILEAGNVLSFEPHCYDPEWGGMRMEQNIVVTENGYELLTHFPLEL